MRFTGLDIPRFHYPNVTSQIIQYIDIFGFIRDACVNLKFGTKYLDSPADGYQNDAKQDAQANECEEQVEESARAHLSLRSFLE